MIYKYKCSEEIRLPTLPIDEESVNQQWETQQAIIHIVHQRRFDLIVIVESPTVNKKSSKMSPKPNPDCRNCWKLWQKFETLSI